MKNATHMYREIHEIPSAARDLLENGEDQIIAAARALRTSAPNFVVTIARGSSDHAATYLKYASELALGLPVASIGPSVASIYGADLKLARAACLAISQSGQSPDIVQMARSATRQGAQSVAITNEPGSPLGKVCNHVVDIRAGTETSVAATKTFVTSVVAGLALLAHWSEDQELVNAVRALPKTFEKAVTFDWPALRVALADRQSLFVLGRGPSLAVSHEAALKFKETCQIHAESYSSAEVLHGPVSVVGEGFPILALAARDASESSITAVCDQLAGQGANVFVSSNNSKAAKCLEFAQTAHPLTDALSLIVSFYAFIEKLAAERGINPDQPRHLRKVTETV